MAKKVEITVVSTPNYIAFDCPHCREEATVDYKEFLDVMPEAYYEDWINKEIICPECGEEVEISSIDFD